MTAVDLIAQATVLGLILLAAQRRDLIADMSDGNIERLIREERNADEARAWLAAMGAKQ